MDTETREASKEAEGRGTGSGDGGPARLPGGDEPLLVHGLRVPPKPDGTGAPTGAPSRAGARRAAGLLGLLLAAPALAGTPVVEGLERQERADLRALARAYRGAYEERTRVGESWVPAILTNAAQSCAAVGRVVIPGGEGGREYLARVDRDPTHPLWGACRNHATFTLETLVLVEQSSWTVHFVARRVPPHQWVEIESARTGQRFTFDGWAAKGPKVTAGSQEGRLWGSGNRGEDLTDALADLELPPPAEEDAADGAPSGPAEPEEGETPPGPPTEGGSLLGQPWAVRVLDPTPVPF